MRISAYGHTIKSKGGVDMGRPSSQVIKCSVKSCKFNDKVQYCTLDDILVGSHDKQAKSKQETDCMSFEPENE